MNDEDESRARHQQFGGRVQIPTMKRRDVTPGELETLTAIRFMADRGFNLLEYVPAILSAEMMMAPAPKMRIHPLGADDDGNLGIDDLEATRSRARSNLLLLLKLHPGEALLSPRLMIQFLQGCHDPTFRKKLFNTLEKVFSSKVALRRAFSKIVCDRVGIAQESGRTEKQAVDGEQDLLHRLNARPIAELRSEEQALHNHWRSCAEKPRASRDEREERDRLAAYEKWVAARENRFLKEWLDVLGDVPSVRALVQEARRTRGSRTVPHRPRLSEKQDKAGRTSPRR